MSFLKTYLSYFALIFVLWNNTAYAHKPSDSYLTIHVNNQTSIDKNSQSFDKNNLLSGQWDIALRDLDFAIGLDTNANSEITWQEVEAKQKDIFAYALARFAVKNNQQECSVLPQQMLIDNHTDGSYAVIKMIINCPNKVNKLTLDYALFSNIDPSHRGLLKIDYVEVDQNNTAKTITKTAIFGPDNPSQTFAIGTSIVGTSSRLTEFKDYVLEGVWHIWIGFDHILFLISLLLPAVLVYTAKKWQAQQNFKTIFFDVLKVVTAFTIAHSITLTMATLQVVELPSRWVEATIAASVILAALNNLFPIITKNRWAVAFVFGLIHGFGFAAVLADLGLAEGTLMIALIGFNVGVEIGQVAILMAFIPLAFTLRKTRFYKQVIFVGGSVVIALIASVWLAERALNLSIFF